MVRKHQTRWTGFDDKIISMYARGMSARDIQGHSRRDVSGGGQSGASASHSDLLISGNPPNAFTPLPLPTLNCSRRNTIRGSTLLLFGQRPLWQVVRDRAKSDKSISCDVCGRYFGPYALVRRGPLDRGARVVSRCFMVLKCASANGLSSETWDGCGS